MYKHVNISLLSFLPLSSELFNVLGGPLRHGDSTEDLWDFLPRLKDAEGVGTFSGGGQEPRPSQDRQSESHCRESSPRPPSRLRRRTGDLTPVQREFTLVIV